jgi:hypothetical protein
MLFHCCHVAPLLYRCSLLSCCSIAGYGNVYCLLLYYYNVVLITIMLFYYCHKLAHIMLLTLSYVVLLPPKVVLLSPTFRHAHQFRHVVLTACPSS